MMNPEIDHQERLLRCIVRRCGYTTEQVHQAAYASSLGIVSTRERLEDLRIGRCYIEHRGGGWHATARGLAHARKVDEARNAVAPPPLPEPVKVEPKVATFTAPVMSTHGNRSAVLRAVIDGPKKKTILAAELGFHAARLGNVLYGMSVSGFVFDDEYTVTITDKGRAYLAAPVADVAPKYKREKISAPERARLRARVAALLRAAPHTTEAVMQALGITRTQASAHLRRMLREGLLTCEQNIWREAHYGPV